MNQPAMLKINRANVAKSDIIPTQTPDESAMQDGTVLFKLDIFGLSTNNITYAVLGNTMGYWNFFPVDEQHSQLPVWGYAHVEASTHPGFTHGDRYYGYFPLGNHLLVKPVKVNPFGFVDANPARKSMNPVYDHYINVKSDATYKPEDEAMQVLYRPLFFTSFLLHDYLKENNNFGAKQIVVTSASSKTAYGFAALLHSEKESANQDYNIVALTSAKNTDFVNSLGIYDEVIAYDNKSDIDNSLATVVVDFTGNQAMLHEIADQLGESHLYTSLIGAVQNDSLEQLEGKLKQGQFFFAPIQAQKCIERWGHQEFNQHYAKAWKLFLDQAKHWVDLEDVNGIEEAQAAYLTLLSGSPSPRAGMIARI
jgi:hypothetical protein